MADSGKFPSSYHIGGGAMEKGIADWLLIFYANKNDDFATA